VTFLCSLPFDVSDIHRVAVRDRERFAPYWTDRETLKRHCTHMLRTGVRLGQLRRVHITRTAEMMLLTDDAAQTWYRQNPSADAKHIAIDTAEMTLRGLLADRSKIADVMRESKRFVIGM
jgi:hypothetical protein